MKGTLVILASAASLSLGACASTPGSNTMAYTAGGAAAGAAAGAGLGAVAGFDPIAGAVVGGAIGGVAGAVWADRNGDGQADGYYTNGQYYAGTPSGYTPGAKTCQSVGNTALTGGAGGAALGAGVGALTGGSILGGAVIGAAVGGLAGAVWADANNDGCVDGYQTEGRYYPGAPMTQTPSANTRAGERG
ncbi:hypothetical protein [Novosphingobium huizhouense]|uniref:hypothetical protein n=1 Tax=Novosphingobium huizhouense TaxID=2866625 RepID=UPI001CD82E8A|nr:hypothetical protein [Novosphingobium huizhouense]